MSTTTQYLGLIQPALSEKHGATTYKANNTIIDNAYGEYLNDYEQSLENVAPIEGDTASTNYSVGQYIIKDGGLYRVTASIASGESIVVGTNVIATSLNEAVASLNNAVASINNAIGTVNVATNGNLQSQIAALQDSVNSTSFEVTASSSIDNNGYFRCRVFGKVAIICLVNIHITDTSIGWVRVGTFQSDLAADAEIRSTIYVDGLAVPYAARVTDGGAIEIYKFTSGDISNRNISGEIVYIMK